MIFTSFSVVLIASSFVKSVSFHLDLPNARSVRRVFFNCRPICISNLVLVFFKECNSQDHS